MYFVCTQAKAGGGGQRSNGDLVFPISPLFPNPRGPKEHVQARSAVQGDFWKKWRKPFLEKSCLAIRLKESRKCCPLSPSSCLSPLQISDNREADVSEQESVIKAHLLEYKTTGSKTTPLCFSGQSPASSQYWPVSEIRNRVACAWAGDKRQAMLPESPGGHSSSCPAELYFKGKVELPFWVRINIINIYQKSQNLYFYAFRIF